MARITDLPSELLYYIIDELAFADRLNLSSHNRRLRQILIPIIFRAIKVDCEPNTARGVAQLLQQCGEYVTDLHLQVALPQILKSAKSLLINKRHPCKKAYGGGPWGVFIPTPIYDLENGKVLPEQLVNLLRGELHSSKRAQQSDATLLPNLSGIKLSFDFDFDFVLPGLMWDDAGTVETTVDDEANDNWASFEPEKEYGMGTKTFVGIEDFDTATQNEKRFIWRSLMAEVWTALCANSQVKRLTIENLIPKPVSLFFYQAWPEFIGGLEELSVSMFGGFARSDELQYNTTSGYRDFVSKLDQYFFQYLGGNARYLKLGGTPSCPFGGEARWGYYMPRNLMPTHIQTVKTLVLEDHFIHKDLLHLIRRCPQLETLILHNCHSPYQGWRVNDGMPWATLFRKLRRAKTTLLELRVTSDDPMDHLWDDHRRRRHLVGQYYVAAKKSANKDSRRKIFSYCGLSTEYGDRYDGGDKTVEMFIIGSDQLEYHLLMKHINEKK